LNAGRRRPAGSGRAEGRSGRRAAPAEANGWAQACERALAEALAAEGPVDAVLRGFFRANPWLGRRDRGAVADTVFDVLRNRRWYGHVMQGLAGPLPRRLMWASWGWRAAQTPPAAPAPPDPSPLPALPPEAAEAVRRATLADPASLPQAARLSLPDWLHEALLAQAAAQGAPDPAADVERLGRALLEAAPLDLRVNPLRGERDAVRAELAAVGIRAEPLAAPATALRVVGKPAIERTAAFERGAVEVQDAGSQRLVDLVAPRRGQTVVDFCAGAGGKALAMAAAMRGTGQVYACDVSAARLQRMKPRLARAGADNIQPLRIQAEHDPRLQRLAGRADRVLVDAPCSGTGTLRRQPELKWRLAPADVQRLAGVQGSILAAAARLVKPGGALIYATCSLLDAENGAVADAFGAAHPGFEREATLVLRPDRDGTDGFFAARWIRRE
jgi:16S rRNA (cytosine967-C5)-methyltransferase